MPDLVYPGKRKILGEAPVQLPPDWLHSRRLHPKEAGLARQVGSHASSSENRDRRRHADRPVSGAVGRARQSHYSESGRRPVSAQLLQSMRG